jgi:hypothetical protein
MALGEIDTESEIDLQGRKDRLELATEAVCKASSNSKKPDN